MKARPTAIHIALLTGGVLAGLLLGRVFNGGAASSSAPAASAPAAPKADAPKLSSAATAAPASSPVTASDPSERSSPRPSASAKTSLDSLLAEHDGRKRLRRLHELIDTLSPAEYPDALKRIRQITNSNERELASRLLLTQWAQSDPDGALQFAAGNRGFEYVAEDVFAQLAAADFDAAVARAKSIPGRDLQYRALRGALSFKADTDPRGALQLARSLGEFQGAEPLTNVVYRQWAANDPQAAALHAADTGQAEDEGWRSPVTPVVQTWAQQDPAAAAQWSLSLSDPRAQARSITQVMREWARSDANAAANWIHSLESTASRDAAVAGLAQALVSRDPQTALGWIATMSDDAARTRTLQRLSGTVMWRDPQNGAAMLEAAGLPPEQIREARRRGR